MGCHHVKTRFYRVHFIGSSLVERGLASFKLPDELQYIDQWPLTSVGKIDKNKLKQQMIK